MRIGVGAAVVLLLAALGIAVAVTAVGQVGHSVEVAANRGQAGSTASGVVTSGPDGPAADAGDPSGAPDSSGAPAAGEDRTGDGSTGPAAAGASAIFVHVLGAVAHPGLFEVHDGARVVDAVAAAGGLLATADQAGVNLARLVSDGEQLYVPAQGEVVAGAPPVAAGGATTDGGWGGTGSGAAVKVNLNTATLADLDTLPRIGPTMAQRILDYRDAQGRFGSIDDLRNVTGIGDKTFAALQDLITV